MTQAIDEAQELIKLIQSVDGKNNVIAFASTADLPLQGHDLAEIKRELDTSSVYQQMAKATEYVQKRAIPQRLAQWRAKLWATGFSLRHPHPVMDAAYRKFAEKFSLNLLVQQAMEHLSTNNNACLIWRENKRSYRIEYVRFYNPAKTRIDRIGGQLWIEPTKEFKESLDKAKPEEIDAYVKRHGVGSSIQKWVDVVKHPERFRPTNTEFMGKIPLSEKDGERWLIFGGDGATDQQIYSPVTLISIFSDLELLQLLADGDWASAFQMKNLITLIKAGESITSGPLAGSRKNWAKQKDLENVQTHMQKAGRAQFLYGNHTLDISFVFPDPKIFAPEKYEAVIERICWAFGIGQYSIVGSSRHGGSYATATWNVQSIRTEARQKREVVATMLGKFLTDAAVMREVFRTQRKIYTHGCAARIEKRRILTLRGRYDNLNRGNVGLIEYSEDGFITNKTYEIGNVMQETGQITLMSELPRKALPEQLRLRQTYKQAVDCYGAPEIDFDQRVLKDDRQNLAELQMLVKQGPLSNMSLLKQFGFRYEQEVSQKLKEWRDRMGLMPVFEANQGLLESIAAGLDELGHVVTEKPDKSAPGEPGRPSTREEQEEGTPQPRPSTA